MSISTIKFYVPLEALVICSSAWAMTLPGAVARAQCDPIEVQKLFASDAQADINFGTDVAISGDLLAISNRNIFETLLVGVYLFRVDAAGQWSEIAKLTASDGVLGDEFGLSICISGSTVIVGARRNDDLARNSGSAYIYEETDGVWSEVAKLTASVAKELDYFGRQVVISGDTAMVSARFGDNGLKTGSVYVFERITGIWTQVAKLTASDGNVDDHFGAGMRLQGDTAMFPAKSDDLGTDSGAVYVFEKLNGVWTETDKLLASDGTAWDQFGASLSLDGDTLAVYAGFADGDPTDFGALYIFENTDGQWTETAKVFPADATASGIGGGISLHEDSLLLGAYRQDNFAGAAYWFRKQDGVWTQVSRITASDRDAGDFFASRVMAQGSIGVFSALEDNDAGEDAGAVYIFDLQCPCLADLNADGILDLGDITTFVSLFLAGDLAADINADGLIDIGDITSFVSAFLAGC